MLTGCQKEDLIKNNSEQLSNRPLVQELDEKEIKSNHFLQAEIETFNSLPQITFSQDEGEGTAYSADDLFIIDETYAKEIEFEGYKFYTFPLIVRDDSLKFEEELNMLFLKDKDDNLKPKAIIMYDITDQQREKLLDHEPLETPLQFTYFRPNAQFHIANGSPVPCSEQECDEGYHLEKVGEIQSDATGWTIPICDCVEDEPIGYPYVDIGPGVGPIDVIIYIPGLGGIYNGPIIPPHDGGGEPGEGGGSNGGGWSAGDPSDTDPIEGLNTGNFTSPTIKPIDKDDEEDPCKMVQEQFKNEDFRDKMNELHGKVNASREWGFSETSDEGISDVTKGKHTSFKFHVSPTTVGGSHSHPIGNGGNIFSPTDFVKFLHVLNSVQHNNDASLEDAYVVMMYGTGDDEVNYMLKFTGRRYYPEVAIRMKNPPLSKKDLNKAFIKYYRNYGKNVVKTFINLVNNKIFDGTSNFEDLGFHLMKFELENDGSLKNTSEISLNNSGEVQEKDCK